MRPYHMVGYGCLLINPLFAYHRTCYGLIRWGSFQRFEDCWRLWIAICFRKLECNFLFYFSLKNLSANSLRIDFQYFSLYSNFPLEDCFYAGFLTLIASSWATSVLKAISAPLLFNSSFHTSPLFFINDRRFLPLEDNFCYFVTTHW